MRNRIIISLISFLVIVSATALPCRAQFTIHSSTAMEVAIIGYSGLDQQTLFDGKLTANNNTLVDTSYRGLALLVCEKGQQYQLILGEQPFTLNIKDPSTTMPSFTGSPENDYFYKLLASRDTEEIQYEFADLIIEAKKLLDSTGSIRTVDELNAMKEKFHGFVRRHYQDLYHSDMLRRLIAQYFMMHEYVDYHVPGAPATDIRKRYNQAILDGVSNWLEILKPRISDNEVLNYIVSLYYSRSMVSLTSLIMDNFPNSAYCPGENAEPLNFPDNLMVTNGSTGNSIPLSHIRGHKVIAFVSADCPVSQATTVTIARSAAQVKDTTLIVVPLQPLSENHVAMQRLVSGGNIMFVDDEKWRQENIPLQMNLPLFVQIE